MNYRLNPYYFVMLASTSALLGAAGCSTLAVNPTSAQTANADAKEAAAVVDTKTPSFNVQFKTEGGRLVYAKQVPLDDKVFLQDALDKSGALKRFRRASIDLVRITPQGAPHRMQVAHDRIKHRVEPQCNYHLHAGDTIVITEDKRTVFDDMMGSLGPFSRTPASPRSSVGG